MKTDMNYPNQYELFQTLSEYAHKKYLVRFSQRRGIFITNANQDVYADFLSGIFWDDKDLDEIRTEALEINSKSSVAGFWLKSEDTTYDLIKDLDRHSNSVINENLNMKLSSITGDEKNGYKGHIEYLQQQPGRVQFLQGTQRDFDFFIQKKFDGNWEILVEGERSNEAKLFADWLETKMPREVDVLLIDQSKMSTDKTIKFFDQLATRALPPEWRIAEVKRIVVKKEVEEENEDNLQEVEKSMLTGISQAILEGNDLRTNSFVKQCEESGYIFSAMTYKYENNIHPFIIEVRAEFKGRPKVFEVGLENFYQRIGISEEIEETSPQFNKTKLLSRFYKEAKNLYDELINNPLPLREQ